MNGPAHICRISPVKNGIITAPLRVLIARDALALAKEKRQYSELEKALVTPPFCADNSDVAPKGPEENSC